MGSAAPHFSFHTFVNVNSTMKTSSGARVMSPLWLIAGSMGLSLAWMLPNHVLPWYGFHGDALCAIMMTAVAIPVLWHNRFEAGWHWFTVVVAFAALIPLAQFGVGMVPLFGTAWINFAYMWGLLLALLVGAAWEQETPGQGPDYLFLALGLASVASVGLQLYQLLDLEPVGAWTLQSSGTRHYANIAQPNQLASLLLLGLLGCAWGYLQKHLSAAVAIGISALLLMGVALTESRTGWLNIALLVVMTLYWRRLAQSRAYLWVVIGLAAYFVACVVFLPAVYDLMWGEGMFKYRSAADNPRWAAWVMFMKAAAQRPWFGFGWGQLGQAQFLMLDEKLWLGASMLQSHNIILDLVLWNGFVIGLGLAAVIAWWVWAVASRLSNARQLTMLGCIVVLGTHAMLEYPLQYAYFLLPVGFLMGGLNVSVGLVPVSGAKKWLTSAVLIIAIATLAITVRDYLRAETSFYGLRFEHKKVESPIPRTPPDVLALTQLRDYIVFARMEPRPAMTAAELEWVQGVITTLPSAFVLYRFAAMLAMNDRPEEAQVWLKRVCHISPPVQCKAIKEEWAKQSLINKSIAAIPWPLVPD